MIFYYGLHDHLLFIYYVIYCKMIYRGGLLFILRVGLCRFIPGFFGGFCLEGFLKLGFISKEYGIFYLLTFLGLL